MLYLRCIEEGLFLLWVFVSVKSSKNWRLQSILCNEKSSFELRADKVYYRSHTCNYIFWPVIIMFLGDIIHDILFLYHVASFSEIQMLLVSVFGLLVPPPCPPITLSARNSKLPFSLYKMLWSLQFLLDFTETKTQSKSKPSSIHLRYNIFDIWQQ